MAASNRIIVLVVCIAGSPSCLSGPSIAAEPVSQPISKPAKAAHRAPKKPASAAPEAAVVTARNRSEVERDVPISITSLTGR